jgi:hypothetical protein
MKTKARLNSTSTKTSLANLNLMKKEKRWSDSNKSMAISCRKMIARVERVKTTRLNC